MLKECARNGAILLLACAAAPAIFAAPPAAATNLSIDQLDQLLKEMYGQGDVKVARQLAGIQLTERAGAAQMAQWEAALHGDRSRKALMAVGDASAFLAPPAAETPSPPPPGAETSKQILARAWDYVEQTLPRFPNFFANRTTTSFAFTTKSNLHPPDLMGNPHETSRSGRFRYEALGPAQASDPQMPQLFFLGSSTQEVTYRGGMEVANSPAPAAAARRAPIQLDTNGEFGAFLGLVVLDISQDQVVWEHWEQGANGLLAVFRYAVPSEKSHFAVTLPDQPSESPAYHGEIAIDPASGAIGRMTLLATTSGVNFFRETSMLVEFAAIEIAGVAYVCPVHAVAMNRYFNVFEYGNTAHTPVPFASSINDVSFTNFHRFRSEAHIVSGATGP
jgi:hypothetical protein